MRKLHFLFRVTFMMFWSTFTIGAIVLINNGYRIYARNQARDSDTSDVQAIAKAMLSYQEKHGRFPPAVLFAPNDTPYSWRVALLPELGLQKLYDEYRRDEPWDGDHNRQLLARIPDVYRSVTERSDATTTAYFALTGPKTAFATTDGLSDPEITDPWESLITVVSARRDIPWTKPEDIEFDEFAPLPEFGGFHEGIFHAATASGHARVLRNPFWNADLLKQLINACDGLPSGCDGL
jgi:hypothetical protein